MARLDPEGNQRPAGDAEPASPWSGDGPSAGASLVAFDTLRALALGREDAGARRLMATARQAVCAGRTSGIMWIVAAQQLEHEGEIPRAVGAYLVAAFAEDMAIATWETDPEIAEIGRRIEAIERAGGLRPGEYWRPDEGPAEWQAAEREWGEAFDRRWQALLRRFGEHELADLLETDREEFERRINSGETALLG